MDDNLYLFGAWVGAVTFFASYSTSYLMEDDAPLPTHSCYAVGINNHLKPEPEVKAVDLPSNQNTQNCLDSLDNVECDCNDITRHPTSEL